MCALTIYRRRRASFLAGYTPSFSGEPGGGHNFASEQTASGHTGSKPGLVVNIKDVDAVLKQRGCAAEGGRTLSQDVSPFRPPPPTAENIVRFSQAECVRAPAVHSPQRRLALWSTPFDFVQGRIRRRPRTLSQGHQTIVSHS